MKKNLFIMALCAMSALVACNKDLPGDDVQNTGDVVTYTATVDGADTKTVIDGRLSKWENGDKITLHNGTTAFEFSTTDEGATADFTYAGNDFSAENGVLAVYPSCAEADLEAKTVKAHISTWQQAREGSYNHDAAVAVAYSENNSLAFKNATALLKFTVKNDNVTHFNFYGKNSEPLSGDVLITLNDDNTIKSVVPQLTEGSYRTNVEVYAWQSEDILYFKSGATYYAAIAPQILAGFGIKLRVNGIDQEVKAYESEFEFKANTIYNLGELEYTHRVYIDDQTGWEDTKVHYWIDDVFSTEWPGVDLSDCPVEIKDGVEYKYFNADALVTGKSVGVIFSNAGADESRVTTGITIDKDRYYTLTAEGLKEVLGKITPEAGYIYLNTGGGSLWDQAGAVFSVKFTGEGLETKNILMEKTNVDYHYKCACPEGSYTHVTFLRHDPNNANLEDSWNSVGPTELKTDLGSCYTVIGWNAADVTWSKLQ